MDKKDKEIIENEILTESLNDMYAQCIEFQEKHPDNKNLSEIDAIKAEIAIAYRQSRIYTDDKHQKHYNEIIQKAKTLIEAT